MEKNDKPAKTTDDRKKVDEKEKQDPKKTEETDKKEARAMHKTTSIFLRNLSPTITKAEVEAVRLLERKCLVSNVLLL